MHILFTRPLEDSHEMILKFQSLGHNVSHLPLIEIEGIKIYGESKNKTSVISFNIGNIHPYDIGSVIDNLGVAVRTGHHCAQPIMDYFKIPGTIRVSFCFYNNFEEIDILMDSLKKAVQMLS